MQHGLQLRLATDGGPRCRRACLSNADGKGGRLDNTVGAHAAGRNAGKSVAEPARNGGGQAIRVIQGREATGTTWQTCLMVVNEQVIKQKHSTNPYLPCGTAGIVKIAGCAHAESYRLVWNSTLHPRVRLDVFHAFALRCTHALLCRQNAAGQLEGPEGNRIVLN